MTRLISCVLALILACISAAIAQDSPPPTGWPTTNFSGTITTGTTFQTILAASNAGSKVHRSITIENNNTNSDNCWLFIGSGTATEAKSILLGAGGSYQRYFPYVPSDALQMTCASNGDSFYGDYQ